MGICTKIKAFTIAEIVVAMMVLSAISMILIPVVMNDSKEKILETSMTKTYTLLQQAAQTTSMQAAQGQIQITNNAASDIMETFKENMKVIDVESKFNEAKAGYTSDCGKNAGNIDTINTVILQNGTFVFLNGNNIIIDVNGAKNPNKTGTDIFYFVVTNSNGAYSVAPKNNCANAKDLKCEAARKLKLDKKR